MGERGWAAIQSFCDIRYMGAAEFEFDTIPGCLRSLMQEAKELVTFPLFIKRKDIKPNSMLVDAHKNQHRAEVVKAKEENTKPPRAKKLPPARTDDAVLYVICRKKDMVEIGEHIRALAKDEIELKRGSGLIEALDPIKDYDRKAIGWLELDNGFVFFLGYEGYVGMADLLGLTPEAEVKT